MDTRKLKLGMITIAASVLLIAVVACEDSLVTDVPAGTEEHQSTTALAKDFDVSKDGPGALTVMTRNVYVGGNVDLVLEAAPQDVPIVVGQVFQELISTDFAERAQSFAREIAATKPHLIGLQEISLIRRQSPGDLVAGGTTPAETVFLDQMDVLMTALAAAGLDYREVGSVENLDVEAPMLTSVSPLSFDDIRLTDYDVLLARADVITANVAEVNYDAVLPVPGIGVLTRGYVAADATVHGRTYRVFTSHLEPVTVPEILPVQLGQIQQLVAATQGLGMPAVVIGDLNTGPGRPGYDVLIASGLVDVWNRNVRPASDGYTCCFPSNLRGDSRTPDMRIDLVLYRPANTRHGNDGLGSVFVDLVGEAPEDITPSGLWPSDHVGVVATLRVPAAAHK